MPPHLQTKPNPNLNPKPQPQPQSSILDPIPNQSSTQSLINPGPPPPGEFQKVTAGVDVQDACAVIGQQWYSWRVGLDYHYRWGVWGGDVWEGLSGVGLGGLGGWVRWRNH